MYLIRTLHVAIVALAAALAAGCAPPAPRAVPVNLAQYENMQKAGDVPYLDTAVAMWNLQRVFDRGLELGQRVDSLTLVQKIGGAMPEVRDQLAVAAEDASMPQDLLKPILAGLLDKPAFELYLQWQKEGYSFAMRDRYLLSQLAADAQRPMVGRQQLLQQIAAELAARSHQPWAATAPATGPAPDSVEAQSARLTLADLWNIHLLAEMLDRPKMQAGLRVVAVQDRADHATAKGGLVLYRDDAADSWLYDPQDGGGDDLEYAPGPKAKSELGKCMCVFHGHFDKIQNAARSGPSAEDLEQARKSNFYGLVLTSLDESHFSAHYYNPQGAVVSLGVFPFQEWK